MRSRVELKRIAKDRLRDAYWPSFAVIAITFFAQTVQFLKNIYVAIARPGMFFTVQPYGPAPDIALTWENLSLLVQSAARQFDWVEFLFGIVGPVLMVGCAAYFLKLLRGQDAKVQEVFGYFHLFFRALGVSILVALICGGVFLLGFLAGYLFFWIIGLRFLGMAFAPLIAAIPAVVVSLGYSMVSFVMADNPNLTALEVMNESRKIMSGEKGTLFVLLLSFLGWIILSALFRGLLTIFIYPYFIATITGFYIDITNPAQLSSINL
ncbi:MAG: DUF975 family protein [Bacillota bacterium]|jgi:uncharacterized membrane protein